MNFKLFFWAAVALVVIGCSADQSIENEQNILPVEQESRVLHITASIPETPEKPKIPGKSETSRSALEEYGATEFKNIRFKWEVGDTIYLRFEQPEHCWFTSDNKCKELNDTVLVHEVSNGGKTAHFTIELPSRLTTIREYNLYAFRSGKKVGEDGARFVLDSAVVVLPMKLKNYKATLEDQVIPLSMWSRTVVPANATNVSLSFNHLGSMMTLKLKNTGTEDITGLHTITLKQNPQWSGHPWLYNRHNDNGGARFYIRYNEEGVNPHYLPATTSNAFMLNFYPENPTIDAGETKAYYAWFVPNSNYVYNVIPDLYLEIKDNSNIITGFTETPRWINAKLVTGKNYVFHATINKNASPSQPYEQYNLVFTDKDYNPLPDPGRFTPPSTP